MTKNILDMTKVTFTEHSQCVGILFNSLNVNGFLYELLFSTYYLGYKL